MATEAQELKLYSHCVAKIAAVLDACVVYPA
jgi:hypothetical protein